MALVNADKSTARPASQKPGLAQSGTTTPKLHDDKRPKGHFTEASRILELSGSSEQAVSGAAIFMGFDINDDDSGNVHVHIRNGTDATGSLIAGAIPANGDHDSHWFGPNGVYCPDGIYIEVDSGTPTGSIFYRQ